MISIDCRDLSDSKRQGAASRELNKRFSVRSLGIWASANPLSGVVSALMVDLDGGGEVAPRFLHSLLTRAGKGRGNCRYDDFVQSGVDHVKLHAHA